MLNRRDVVTRTLCIYVNEPPKTITKPAQLHARAADTRRSCKVDKATLRVPSECTILGDDGSSGETLDVDLR